MKILDPTCSVKGIWFNKNTPGVISGDIRVEDIQRYRPKRNTFEGIVIHPDVQMDYIAMPFVNDYFDMVVWDPPFYHSMATNSWITEKYGRLIGDWETNLMAGFSECFRVLRDEGTLIMKWNTSDKYKGSISLKKLLSLAPRKPLFGHRGNNTGTHWLCFIKR